MYCSKCGAKVEANARYCDSCGEAIVRQSTQNSAPTASETPVTSNIVANAQSPNNGGSPNDTSNKNSNIWMPVAFAGGGALVGWYIWGLGGFVLGLVGANMATQQKKHGINNQFPRTLTYILAIIDAIFWVISMTA